MSTNITNVLHLNTRETAEIVQMFGLVVLKRHQHNLQFLSQTTLDEVNAIQRNRFV